MNPSYQAERIYYILSALEEADETLDKFDLIMRKSSTLSEECESHSSNSNSRKILSNKNKRNKKKKDISIVKTYCEKECQAVRNHKVKAVQTSIAKKEISAQEVQKKNIILSNMLKEILTEEGKLRRSLDNLSKLVKEHSERNNKKKSIMLEKKDKRVKDQIKLLKQKTKEQDKILSNVALTIRLATRLYKLKALDSKLECSYQIILFYEQLSNLSKVSQNLQQKLEEERKTCIRENYNFFENFNKDSSEKEKIQPDLNKKEKKEKIIENNIKEVEEEEDDDEEEDEDTKNESSSESKLSSKIEIKKEGGEEEANGEEYSNDPLMADSFSRYKSLKKTIFDIQSFVET